MTSKDIYENFEKSPFKEITLYNSEISKILLGKTNERIFLKVTADYSRLIRDRNVIFEEIDKLLFENSMNFVSSMREIQINYILNKTELNMKEKVTEILNLLEGNDEQTKKEILLECATKLGSEEWATEVKDLWKRMENLNKKE